MNWIKGNYYIGLFLGLNMVFIMTLLISNTLSTEEDYQIRIEHGDSLWELANKFGADEPKEAWINKVMAMNNLQTENIRAGDILVIPEIKENYLLDYSTEIAGDSK